MKATKGPWIVNREHGTYDQRGKGHFSILHPLINTADDQYKGTIGGFHIVIGDRNCQPGYILNEADAHLIAAAPEMLDILVYIAKYYSKNIDIMPISLQGAIDQVCDIIARAEGRE